MRRVDALSWRLAAELPWPGRVIGRIRVPVQDRATSGVVPRRSACGRSCAAPVAVGWVWSALQTHPELEPLTMRSACRLQRSPISAVLPAPPLAGHEDLESPPEAVHGTTLQFRSNVGGDNS